MSSSCPVPHYANFRDAIETLYPECAGALAVRRFQTWKDPMRDVAEQLWPPALERLRTDPDAQLALSREHARLATIFSGQQLGFFAVSFPRSAAGAPVALIYADPVCGDAHDMFYNISSRSVPSLCMKFSAAALRQDILHWALFYHELCHGLIGIGRHAYPYDDVLADHIEESVCDVFGALHALRIYGDDAVAPLRTMADMRLSRFEILGARYYTAPALHAVLDDFVAGRIAGLRGWNGDAMFKRASRYAHNHYLDRAVARDLAKIYDDEEAYLGDGLSPAPYVLSYRIERLVRRAQDGGSGRRRDRLRDVFRRAQAVLQAEYRHVGIAATIRGGWARLWRHFV